LAVLFTDDFNRANGAPGGNWASNGTMTIVSNQLRLQDFGSIYAINSTAPGTADYEVEAAITLGGLSAGGSVGIGIVGRYQDVNNFYLAWIDSGAANVILFRVQSGGYTPINNWNNGSALASPVTLKLRMSGTSLEIWVNGVMRVPYTDSGVGAAGVFGFRAFNPSDGNLSAARFDNLVVSNLISAPVYKDLTGSSSGGASVSALMGKSGIQLLTGAAVGQAITGGGISRVGTDPVYQALLIRGDTEAVACNWTMGTTQPLTIAFWCRLDSNSAGHGNVMTLASVTFDDEVGFWIPDFRPGVYQGSVMIAEVQTDVLSPSVLYGTWHHVVFSRDDPSGIFRGYLDGVPFPSEAGITPSPNGTIPSIVYLVVGVGGPSHYFRGAMSQLRVWLARLSQAEIVTEMLSTNASRLTNLYGDWQLDGTLLDTSGNNRHLSGVSMPTAGAVTYTTGPGAFADMTAHASGTSAVTAAISRSIVLVGQATGTSTTGTGVINSISALVGAAAGEAVTGGSSMGATKQLAGFSQGRAFIGSQITRMPALVGASSGGSATGGVIVAVPPVAPTGDVNWDGSGFNQGGAGVAVTWDGDAFTDSISFPGVAWEDDHFEETG